MRKRLLWHVSKIHATDKLSLIVLVRYCLWILLSIIASGASVSAQTPEAESSVVENEQQKREWDEKFLNLERRVYDQNELSLRRLENVEDRIDSSERHFNSILLIFALTLLLVFLFMGNNLRLQQRLATERVQRATDDAQNLMKDIQRALNRPEMEYLRISQLLRRAMRRLRNPQEVTFEYKKSIEEIRNAGQDPYLPTALHFIARILSAENDGHWNIAAQMLDQLREMDPKDPDVLLHLSHVHKNIASRTAEVKVRNRHQRLAYQYYGQFITLMQAENTFEENDISSSVSMPVIPNFSIEQPVSEPPATPPPAAVQSEIVKPTKQVEEPVKPEKKEAKTVKPVEKTVVKKVDRPPTSQAILSTVPAVPAAPPVTKEAKAQTADKSASQKQNLPIPSEKAEKSKDIARGFFNFKENMIKKSKRVLDKSLEGVRSVTQFVHEKNDTPLPFLPVPPLSEIPEKGDKSTIDMWKAIRLGDQAMSKATFSKSIRDRNSCIDKAITHYTEAQAYKTNRVLYYNWGVSLLAKALHVPEKKRAPLYNAAIDKFMAGNVVSPHYFDFHLASLYAITGNHSECQRWLAISHEHDSLDIESLQQAPDFDSVRNEPWFDQFIQS